MRLIIASLRGGGYKYLESSSVNCSGIRRSGEQPSVEEINRWSNSYVDGHVTGAHQSACEAREGGDSGIFPPFSDTAVFFPVAFGLFCCVSNPAGNPEVKEDGPTNETHERKTEFAPALTQEQRSAAVVRR